MSKKTKSPQQKKAESYEHDRRNVYGENAKSSRKNIRRGKAVERRAERRSANQALVGAERATSPEVADSMQSAATKRHHRRFKKVPDATLGDVVPKKVRRRAASAKATERRNGAKES